MSERFDSFIAVLLPVIAVTWVVMDATAGLASAGRQIQTVAPAPQTAAPQARGADTTHGRSPTSSICSASGSNSLDQGMQHLALQGLCKAGFRFTASLPNT